MSYKFENDLIVDVNFSKIIISSCDLNFFSKIKFPKNIKIFALDCESFNENDLYLMPVWTICFLANSAKGIKNLEKIQQIWKNNFHINPPELIKILKINDQLNLINLINEQLIYMQQRLSQRNVSFMKSLSALRIAHEEMQDSFRKLERYAVDNFLISRNLALAFEPISGIVQLDEENSKLIQYLPISSLGISDIAIYISSISKTSVGNIIIDLITLEDNEVVGNWIIDVNQLRIGWLRLGLIQCLGTDERSLKIQIKWIASDVLSAALSFVHPEEKWCAISGIKSVGKVLALKIWRSLPDSRPAITSISIPTFSDKLVEKYWLISQEQMEAVENYSASHNYVDYLPGSNEILVHPLNNNPSLARLPLACPVGLTHIWSNIRTVTEAKNIIEFSLIIIKNNLKKHFPIDSHQLDIAYQSEWVRLSPGEHSEVHLFLQKPLSDQCDLYLATRIDVDVSNENCQAYFSNIRASS